MPLSEQIYDDKVGAAVLYGKTEGGGLVALQVDADGKIVVAQ